MTDNPTREFEFYLAMTNICPSQERRMEVKSALETVLDAFDKGATSEEVSKLIRDYLPSTREEQSKPNKAYKDLTYSSLK